MTSYSQKILDFSFYTLCIRISPPTFFCLSTLKAHKKILTARPTVNVYKLDRSRGRQRFTRAPALEFLDSLPARVVPANQKLLADSPRINHVLAALNEEAVKAVSDLIGQNTSYGSLKDRLLKENVLSAAVDPFSHYR